MAETMTITLDAQEARQFALILDSWKNEYILAWERMRICIEDDDLPDGWTMGDTKNAIEANNQAIDLLDRVIRQIGVPEAL